mgnify:CR=1 FL=1
MKSEYFYGLQQRVGRAPVIRKLGAIKVGMEQTPVTFRGELYFAESQNPDAVCDRAYIRVRKESTGEVSAPFGKDYYFASAFADDEKIYVFATSSRDFEPLTMYQQEDASTWHDPRGGHEVRMFSSVDLVHWEERDVLHIPEKRLWNTSVCYGDGRYVMAIEVSEEEGHPDPFIGTPFTCFFAESRDLEHWTMMSDEYSYTAARYNACPVLRFANGYFYMICLEAFPCARYAPYIYRTKNFLDWEVGFHNPIMMWGDDDRKVKPGCHLTAQETDMLENRLNINCSDLDLIEQDGKTRIFYANGDQLSYSFLCEAEYDGPLTQFLEHFFK